MPVDPPHSLTFFLRCRSPGHVVTRTDLRKEVKTDLNAKKEEVRHEKIEFKLNEVITDAEAKELLAVFYVKNDISDGKQAQIAAMTANQLRLFYLVTCEELAATWRKMRYYLYGSIILVIVNLLQMLIYTFL